MTWRNPLILVGVAGLVLAAAAIAFQDDIVKYYARPKTPFQVAAAPLAPDYAERGAWALWPDDPEAGLADIFYAHSTTFYSREGWNASINDGEADSTLEKIVEPNEAGPFADIGAVYGPRYRQATLAALFTHKFDGVAARKRAYGDVRRAFQAFLDASNPNRSIILVGYGQGGLYVQGLLKDYFQRDQDLRARLAATYVIGQATPLAIFDDTLEKTGPCLAPEDIRCVVAYADYEARFDEEMERLRHRSMVWSAAGELVPADGALLCVNPLSWTATPDYVAPQDHVGAASATGLRFGETPPPVAHAIGARCVDGVLVVDRPRQDYLRRRGFLGAKWRAQHFNLFYYDLAEDARRRLANLAVKREEEYRFLQPIDETLDLETSPIHKVPPP
ncbi:MAG: DUF3089 domain-containing protein [Amphiplicatus sp.]